MSDTRNYKLIIKDLILVTKKGGTICVRPRIEEFEGDMLEMHKRINGRYDRYHPVSVAKEPNKAKREENQAKRDSFHNLIKGQLNSAELGKTIERTIKVDGRDRFTYALTRISLFGHDVLPESKVKCVVYDGIVTPEQRQTALKRGQVVLHKGVSTPEQQQDALKELYAIRERLGMNPDGTPKETQEVVDVPFDGPHNVVEFKKPEEKKEEVQKTVTKSGTIKLSKRQLNECKKFNIDPENLPSSKPKGMNNKVWNSIVKAA